MTLKSNSTAFTVPSQRRYSTFKGIKSYLAELKGYTYEPHLYQALDAQEIKIRNIPISY